MSSLHRFSQPKEESKRSFLILSAGSREEALRALTIAQCAMPAVTGLLVTKKDISHLLQVNLPETEQSGNPLRNPAYTDDKPIPAAELSARTYNALLKGRITTISQLCAMELRDLMLLRNFGKKAVEEAVAYRTRLGVPLALANVRESMAELS
ncbi:MAG: DNA-directed RNA polymerase subunit alpha C-terminal domain-containing protein [Janthinobacterium lividum]